MQRSGYLLLADISGYTGFVAGTEAEHSAQIVESLIQVLLDETRPPFRVQEIEGDAVFSWAATTEVERASLLLDVIECTYAAFRSSLDDIGRNTTCTCRACATAGDLDLKFVLHHGAFTPREVGGHRGIGGPDVVLAHRLLKNRVREVTAIEAYALLTRAAVEAAEAEAIAEGMVPHVESVDSFGDVEGFVHDLSAYWARECAQRTVVVDPEDAFLTLARTVPGPRLRAWQVYTDPRHRQRWLTSDSIRVSGLDRGRHASGTVEHCVHGRSTHVIRTLDWKPIRYVTQAVMMPLGGRMPYTAHFEDADGGTEVRVVYGRPQHDRPALERLLRLMMAAGGRSLRKVLDANHDRYAALMREAAERDAAA